MAHNQLRQRSAEFDDPSWHLDHSRLLTELERDLRERGLEPEIESPFSMPLDKKGAALAGQMDCLVVDPTTRLATVYDCKTRRPKPQHKLQVLVYMHTLTKRLRFRDLGLRGSVVYPDRRDEIPRFPEGFASDFDFWVKLLLSEEPPRRVPGPDCRFCQITVEDCSERVEWGTKAPGSPEDEWFTD
jgi:hypothetical protein